MFKITLQIRENEFHKNFSKIINYKFSKLSCTHIDYIRAINGRSTSSIKIKGDQTGVFPTFWTSDQSLVKENCHNSRTSNEIDMELGPVTKLPRFPIYGQFGAIRKPNSGCIVYKTYILINSSLLSYKN